MTHNEFERLSELFKIFGTPAKLRIFHTLADKNGIGKAIYYSLLDSQVLVVIVQGLELPDIPVYLCKFAALSVFLKPIY